jgi:hypothetical protein
MHKNKHFDALLECLGTRTEPRNGVSIEEFEEQDWSEIIRLSIEHRVAPILYKRLKNYQPNKSIPEVVLRKLGVIYVLSERKQNAIFGDLVKVFTKLTKDGISFIVLKGPHLAETIYGDLALRPFGDLDILVKEEEVPKACSSIMDIGYSPKEANKNSREHHHHLPTFYKKDSLPVEIHIEISSTKRLPSRVVHETLWERASSVEIGGVEVLVLSLEDLLLHLSLHICQHNFEVGLIHVFDFYEIIRQRKNMVSWLKLMSRANIWNSKKVFYLTLEIVRKFFNLEVPKEVLDDLRPRDFSVEILEWAECRIFTKGDIRSPNLVRVAQKRGFWAKLKLIFEIVFSYESVSAKYNLNRNPYLIIYCYALQIGALMARCVMLGPKMFGQEREELIKREQMAQSLQKWLSVI